MINVRAIRGSQTQMELALAIKKEGNLTHLVSPSTISRWERTGKIGKTYEAILCNLAAKKERENKANESTPSTF